jgi:hypothetical protein
MNANKFLSALTTSAIVVASILPIFGKVELTANSNSIIPGINVSLPAAQAANYMDDYFANGNVISLNNYGQFLNLHFLNKGGMIQSSNADGTDDQKFLVIRKPGTNQIQLQRINSDRFIITPSAFLNQAPLEAWQRNESIPFHGMQTWYVDVASTPGTFWLKPLGAPQFALNLPYGGNNVKSTLSVFDPSDRDMEWNVQVHSRGNGTPTPQPQTVDQPQAVQPTPQPQVQQTVVTKTPKWNGPCVNSMTICETSRYTRREGERYVAIIAALRTGNQYQGTNPLGQVGHSAFGVAKVWNEVTIARMSNNTEKEVSRMYSYDDNLFTSVSAPGFGMQYATQVNQKWDRELIAQWFTNQAPRVNQLSFRALTISEDTFKKFASTSKGGYSSHYLSGKCYVYTGLYLGVSGTCNCVTISTNLFKQATGESYTNVSSQVPLFLAQSIDKNNGLSDWGR